MFVKRHKLISKALFLALAVVLLSGCAHYIVRKAKTEEIETTSAIGIVVKGNYASPSLATFMASALINGGFSAKVIDPSELIPLNVRESINPDYKYSFLEALVMSMYSGKAQLKGNKELLQNLFDVNDLREANTRLEDLLSLIEKFVSSWELKYLMTIEKLGQYSYSVRLTDVHTKTLAFVYYIDANESGWTEQVKLPDEMAGVSSSSSAQKGPQYAEMQFCEHIVSLLKE